MSSKSLLFLAGLVLTLASCSTSSPDVSAKIAARNQEIAQEPRGDHFIGRRFNIPRTQFWGYVRRPGESWDRSKLVMMNESRKYAPDRVPEEPLDGSPAHGFDHNREYRLTGYYSGQTIYDPNSDLFLPEFVLTGYQVLKENGGWLFNPNERYDGRHLLRVERGANAIDR